MSHNIPTIATICARGGSIGVPRKNVRILNGKPLILHTIDQAMACSQIDQVYVSSDDDEIMAIAKSAGAEVLFKRPVELATSKSGKLPVIQHLVEHVLSSGVAVKRIVDLDPTSPLREVSDISNAIKLLTDDVDTVITGYPSDKNPYFNMVEYKSDHNVGLVKHLDTPVLSRQTAPTVYAMNASIYVWHAHSLNSGLWDGRTALYQMPHIRSVDIDSELDFKLVEMLMKEKHHGK